ncbi:hypothetical protein ACN47E_008349 [Coniothyrium glycines]
MDAATTSPMSTQLGEECFASGRYSKRKRTQINYTLEELEVSDDEPGFESPSSKKHKARTPTSRPLPKQKIFPFMELPAEIRNMIYTYTLTFPEGIHFVPARKHMRRTVERITPTTMSKASNWNGVRLNNRLRKESNAPVPLNTSLLYVCKQIHQETREILYSNEFVFSNSLVLYSFLVNLGPSRSKSLRRLRLLNWVYGRAQNAYNHACFGVMVWATGITSFQIDARLVHFRDRSNGAEKFYRNAFPWLEAVGVARGKADVAVDVLRFGEPAFDWQMWRYPDWVDVPQAEREKDFTVALRKRLITQHKRMTEPVKKRKVYMKKAKNDE